MGMVAGRGYQSAGLATNYCVSHDLVPSPLLGFSFPTGGGGICTWTVVLYVDPGLEYINIILRIFSF